ncbi:MAG: sigma 54-interacting transcriptional regulator [Candidatus Zixiibacteriota bacterium]|nr:MAG: sigma 54-interacting transcriptional regulator [candidate division Zixibacteria bacterium]
MDLSPPKLSIDNRLLVVEEFLRQRKYREAEEELAKLQEPEFESRDYELGLYLLLRADCYWYAGNYRHAIDDGLRSAELLANSPLNLRYGRVQLVLSISYAGIGDMKNAEIRGRDALSAFRRVGDHAGQVDSLNNLAHIAFMRSDYHGAVSILEQALEIVGDDQRQRVMLSANISQLRVHTGQWQRAAEDLAACLEFFERNNEEIRQARLLLILGFLCMRENKLILANRNFDRALEIIGRQELKREKVIYLEYTGELALLKGDIYKAKAILGNAYEKGMLLAPESALVSQSARLLAEVELCLDNVDEAMKYGQKALEVSLNLGERLEVGLSQGVIAQAFAAKNNYEEALENIYHAVDIVAQVGDPLETGKTLLTLAEIEINSGSRKIEKIRDTFDKARRIFVQLGLDHRVAEVDFRFGMFSCHSGDFTSGFEQLNRAEKMFVTLNDKTKARSVNNFLKGLSQQAVALSVSQENEFKVFGNLISPVELSNLKSGDLDEILGILLRRAGGDRAVVYSPAFEASPVEATFSLTPHQVKKFGENFRGMLGEEISRSKPTLILDCRKDPFINGLFAETADTVASVIIVPFRMSDNSTSYLYVDRLSHDNGLNPFNQTQLNFAVGFSDIIAFKWAEIQKNKLLEDNLRLKSQLREKAAFPNIITQSAQLLDMLMQVRQVVNSNISITIEGETGTGKDLLVRAIHYNSHRRDRRFMSVNCAALPETLLESELFGYQRGAFTGADRDKAGLFEEADGGTFFLDEIGDMPVNIQAKVLRVLEEKELVRLGETTPRQVDVRIISATNKDLRELMSSGQFRQDLYYRLSALTFRLPPLRERKEDIPLLIEHFLRNTGKRVAPELMKLLVGYDWPGNVRELENEIKKLVLLAGDGEIITTDAVSPKIAGGTSAIRAEKAREIESSEEIVFDETYSLYDYLAYHEKRFIIKALKEKNGVKKHAAELLNIPESTLRLKIKQYDINLKSLR